MLVKDVMTHRAETIGPDETIQAAAAKMRELGVGALVVCEGERPIGVLTDRDIVVRCIADGRSPREADVRGAMTPQVLECRDDEELEGAVMQMERGEDDHHQDAHDAAPADGGHRARRRL